MDIESWIELRMLYSQSKKPAGNTLHAKYLSPGDMIFLKGRWQKVQCIIRDVNVLTIDGDNVQLNDLPPDFRYKKRTDLWLLFSMLTLTVIAAVASVLGVMIALFK